MNRFVLDGCYLSSCPFDLKNIVQGDLSSMCGFNGCQYFVKFDWYAVPPVLVCSKKGEPFQLSLFDFDYGLSESDN